MSINTRYALANAGVYSTAKPTPKNSCGPATKIFFPFKEGSGATCTDVGKSGLVIDDASVDWVVTWGGPANTAVITGNNGAPTGTVPDVSAAQSFVMWVATRTVTTPALMSFNVGTTAATNPYIGLNGTAINVRDDAAATASISVTGLVAGDDDFIAIVFNRATGIMSGWWGKNGTLSITSTPTGAASIASIAAITTGNFMSFGGTAQNYYSGGLIVLSAIPSDYVTFLQELYATAFSATPRIPDRWIHR